MVAGFPFELLRISRGHQHRWRGRYRVADVTELQGCERTSSEPPQQQLQTMPPLHMTEFVGEEPENLLLVVDRCDQVIQQDNRSIGQCGRHYRGRAESAPASPNQASGCEESQCILRATSSLRPSASTAFANDWAMRQPLS
jgi:hypothetical protein